VSDGPSPTTWKDARPYITWGSLVFTCFLVFIEKLIEQSYGQALAALLLGLGIASVALHSKVWLERTNPNWAFAGASILVAALLTLPFIEERRWPFLAPLRTIVIHETPSPEEIAKLTAPIQSKLDAMSQQKDQAQATVENLRRELAARGGGTNPINIPGINGEATIFLIQQLRDMGDDIALGDKTQRYIVLTAPPEQQHLVKILREIIQIALPSKAALLAPPDSIRVLDAPKLPTPNTDGIVMHGIDAMNGVLEGALQNCFVIKQERATPAGLDDYYGFRNAPNKPIILWVAIGSGSPWKDVGGCRR
jgi:hypothetical protein